jgi:hypothetical protein
MTVALASIAAIAVAALLGAFSLSTGVWCAAAVGIVALVSARFHRHADLPDSVKLH